MGDDYGYDMEAEVTKVNEYYQEKPKITYYSPTRDTARSDNAGYKGYSCTQDKDI